LSKLEYGQCLAAALAWLVLQQQDAVSLMTFDEQVRSSVPPSNSAPHLKHILHVLESVEPGGVTRAGMVLHELAEKLGKRGVVVIISDLLDQSGALATGLRHLRHQRHDVIVLHVLDAAELEFPFATTMRFRGLEEMHNVVADPAALRRAYLAELHQHLDAIQFYCQEREIDYRLVRTDQPFDVTLSAILSSRASRVK
jgi:uncharacterized protein (DUF58 family)